LIDNGLADVTERSDVIGKYSDVDHDLFSLSYNGSEENIPKIGVTFNLNAGNGFSNPEVTQPFPA